MESDVVTDDKDYFNPLPRKEGDARLADTKKLHQTISIHSLVKRETIASGTPNVSGCNFNPLPRKEGDCWSLRNAGMITAFQSTPS